MNTADTASNPSRLGKFLDWLQARTGLPGALRPCPVRETVAGAPWWSLWVSLVLFGVLIQALTGFFLWLHYSPSAQTAWESVYYLQYEVPGGCLLRGMHHWAAQVLVALLGIYVIQMIVRGAYRAPRELVFWTALAMLLAAMGLCLTGDLLCWDQNGYASTKTRVSFLTLLPWIGEPLYRVAVGGPDFGHLTLTRFLALHVGCFASGLLALLLAHLWVARRAAGVPGPAGNGKPPGEPQAPGCCSRALWHGLACLGLLVVVLAMVFGVGLELGAPADRDPANFYSAARPEWSFRGLYGFSNAFPGELKILPIFVFPTIFLGLVFLMPVIAYWRPGHALNLLVLAVLGVGLVGFSCASWWHDWQSPDYRQARQVGQEEAARARELVRGPEGIPPTGALAVLRSDPKTQGPKLWQQQCAVCHDYQDPAGRVAPTEKPTAPELRGFASREWIAGFLDPRQISGPKYFGNTRFAHGVMVRYVESRFAKLKDEDRGAIVAALSAEARLASQAAQDAQDQALIARGRKLIAGNECARCHRFYDAGVPGVAPDLTGYGSREWLLGILADPAHWSFYGLRNDRMPAYVEAPAQPAVNRLPAEQLGLIADWMRGEWYEPGAEPAQPPDPSNPSESQAPKTPVLLALGAWEARRVKQDEPPADQPAALAQFLYQREHCAICHAHTGSGSGDVVPRDPSAPDLGGFASKAWITGLLDPKQVAGPKYFGNTAFKDGSMVDFVKGNLRELKKEIGQEEFDALVAALAAEAQRSPKDPAGKPAAGEEAAVLLEDFTCTDCHKFYDKGALGNGPDLTGYGSRAWLVALLSDPADRRFYGRRNDGMPSYAKSPNQPQHHLLSPKELEVLADWLRSAGQSESR